MLDWGTESQLNEPFHVWSVTKTMSAALFGVLASRTDVDENTLVSEWQPVGSVDNDAYATALTQPPLNPEARMFHVLTTTGHNPLLGYGQRLPWAYDSTGAAGMNSLVQVIDNAVKANPEAFPGSTTARDLAANELFQPLGMTNTDWAGVLASISGQSTVLDLARFGQLLLRQGRWNGRQIIDRDYVYRMTHPQIEDVNTAYGYLTWLNSTSYAPTQGDANSEQTCSPYAGWRTYPHAPTFDAPDDNGGAPFRENLDVGVFWAEGAFGQFVFVHPGLDLVIVARDNPSHDLGGHRIWHLMRPALVALDPVYRGDEAAFCAAYRSSQYAPDLVRPWRKTDGFGPSRLGAR